MNEARDNPVVLSAVDDMFFSARIDSTAKLVGVRVIRILDAEQLEKTLGKSPPQMIILDLNNRTLAPLETVRRIKADPRLSQIRIVGFLSHVQRELEQGARRAGCDQVMPKSAFSARLKELLESIKGAAL